MKQPIMRQPVSAPPTGQDTRPFGTIVAELWENTEQLARQEVSLGLAQLDVRVDQLKGDLLRATLGGAVMYAGVLALVAAIVLALSKVMDPWLSALITAIAVLGAGYALMQRGKQRLVQDATNPQRRTMRPSHSMKEAFK